MDIVNLEPWLIYSSFKNNVRLVYMLPCILQLVICYLIFITILYYKVYTIF